MHEGTKAIKFNKLVKNFRNFLRNNNRRARNRNNVDSKNMKKNETTKNNTSKKSKDKVVQSSNNSFRPTMFLFSVVWSS